VSRFDFDDLSKAQFDPPSHCSYCTHLDPAQHYRGWDNELDERGLVAQHSRHLHNLVQAVEVQRELQREQGRRHVLVRPGAGAQPGRATRSVS
jgi:hypothetical protein